MSEYLDYNSFAKDCLEKLKVLQDQFLKEYDVNSYENWYYNQGTGLLTFSTGDDQINFKYFSVGSFSERSNTWKWSWDNDTTHDYVKEQIYLIRELGEKAHYPKLTNGTFESDEYEAWEFAAIGVHLTNGIGVYRPVSDNQLKLFLVVTEFVDNMKAQDIKDSYIECDSHEYQRIAYVCQHLNTETKVGFEEAFETYLGMELEEEDDLQAWCAKCETVRQKEGEWNEKSMAFAQIKLVCEKCYFEMKEFNQDYKAGTL